MTGLDLRLRTQLGLLEGVTTSRALLRSFAPLRSSRGQGQPKRGPVGGMGGIPCVRRRHHGRAVGGPTEASASPRLPTTHLSGGPKSAGQNGFGDFCRNKSHPSYGAGAPAIMIVAAGDTTKFSIICVRIYFWKEYLLPVGRRLFNRSCLAHELRVLHDI